MSGLVANRQGLVSMFRGVAICMVIIVHLAGKMFPEGAIRNACQFGQMGCQVFFVLSSYCLCCSLQNNKISTAVFFKKRLSSIVPGYWLAIAIGLILSFFFPNVIHVDCRISAVLQNVLLLNGLTLDWNVMNNVVMGGWFIGTLVLMYALFPLLYKIYFIQGGIWKKCRVVVFPVIIVIICWALMVVSGTGAESFCVNNSVKYLSLINQLPSFVIGFSLYDIVCNDDSDHSFVCFALFVLLITITLILFYFPTKLSFVICPTTMAIAVMFLFSAAYGKNVKFSNGICMIGDKSYSVYLSHFWAVCIGAFFLDKGMTIFIVLPLTLIAIAFVAILFDGLQSIIRFR